MAALGQNEGKAPVTTAKALEKEFLPRHVAIIMDGNGRWAQKRGLLLEPADAGILLRLLGIPVAGRAKSSNTPTSWAWRR